MRAAFITNARSGRRKDVDALHAAIEAAARDCGTDVSVESCEALGQLDRLVESAISRGADVIFAVGGDGTVHETARRLIGRGVALGIVPTGSGNGLARHLGIPMDVPGAVSLLTSGRIEPIDTVDVNGQPFFGVAGVGFDAVVAHRFAASSTRGLETYIVEATKAILTYKREFYRIDIDGEPFATEAFLIAVANSKQWGNEAKVAPLASVQDGLLDVSILTRAPLENAPSMLRQLFEGTLQESAHLKLRRGRVVTIERRSEGPAHLDGEAVVLPAKLVFAVKPRSLRVLVPGDREI